MVITIDTRKNPPVSNIGLVSWEIPEAVQRWTTRQNSLLARSGAIKPDQASSGMLHIMQEPLYKMLVLLTASCRLKDAKDLTALSLINTTLDNLRDNVNLIARS